MDQDTGRTGRSFALALQAAYPSEDWTALVAERAGETRDTVEWHFQEDMTPPRHIAEAATALIDGAPKDGKPPQGNVAPDDLPFAGVPNALGKLYKD